MIVIILARYITKPLVGLLPFIAQSTIFDQCVCVSTRILPLVFVMQIGTLTIVLSPATAPVSRVFVDLSEFFRVDFNKDA